MYVATRTLRYRGATYAAGDRVPAEGWPARRGLVAARRIRQVPDPEPTVIVETDGQGGDAATEGQASTGGALDLSALTRAELNAVAAANGVADPASYPNKGALVDAIEGALTAPDGGNRG